MTAGLLDDVQSGKQQYRFNTQIEKGLVIADQYLEIATGGCGGARATLQVGSFPQCGKYEGHVLRQFLSNLLHIVFLQFRSYLF